MITAIKAQTGAAVRRICAILKLPRSSYYHRQQPTPSQIKDQQIGDLVEWVFTQHRRRYGYRRIHCELKEAGVVCSAARIRRLMKERGLKALSSKRFIPVTSDGRADAPSPNLLFEPESKSPGSPNRVWVGDITYIPTREGWRYLAVVMDLCSRRVLGWSLSNQMRSDLVCDALRKALRTRPRQHQLIFHSDRGSQYGSRSFRTLLRQAGITQSMSRRANPYDNACMESFMGTLKLECVHASSFDGEAEARAQLFSFIDGYYNTSRRHSSLDYLSPQNFENQYYKN